MCLKILIIIILNIYSQAIIVKAVLIFFTVLCYTILVKYKKPYIDNEINKIEYLATFICAISI